MKKSVSKLLCFSVLINIIFTLLFSFVIYQKRSSIKKRINKILVTNKIANQEFVINNAIQEPVYGSYVIENPKKTIKIAFLGNSISYLEKTDLVGWQHTSGMAASCLENDYIHKTVEKIANTKKVNIDYTILTLADFEVYFETFNLNRLDKINEFDPEYIIFQLGENVSKDDVKNKNEIFHKKYNEIINYVGNNKTKIVCLPFWYSADKNQTITKVALDTQSYLVDLSHLGDGLDERNYAISEKLYTIYAVGIHPGDFGMENISDNIFSVFNVILN